MVRHGSEDEAEREAERSARKQGGEFYVLKAVMVVRQGVLVKEWLLDGTCGEWMRWDETRPHYYGPLP